MEFQTPSIFQVFEISTWLLLLKRLWNFDCFIALIYNFESITNISRITANISIVYFELYEIFGEKVFVPALELWKVIGIIHWYTDSRASNRLDRKSARRNIFFSRALDILSDTHRTHRRMHSTCSKIGHALTGNRAL